MLLLWDSRDRVLPTLSVCVGWSRHLLDGLTVRGSEGPRDWRSLFVGVGLCVILTVYEFSKSTGKLSQGLLGGAAEHVTLISRLRESRVT